MSAENYPELTQHSARPWAAASQKPLACCIPLGGRLTVPVVAGSLQFLPHPDPISHLFPT